MFAPKLIPFDSLILCMIYQYNYGSAKVKLPEGIPKEDVLTVLFDDAPLGGDSAVDRTISEFDWPVGDETISFDIVELEGNKKSQDHIEFEITIDEEDIRPVSAELPKTSESFQLHEPTLPYRWYEVTITE